MIGGESQKFECVLRRFEAELFGTQGELAVLISAPCLPTAPL